MSNDEEIIEKDQGNREKCRRIRRQFSLHIGTKRRP
jgi:hypothetical protein